MVREDQEKKYKMEDNEDDRRKKRKYLCEKNSIASNLRRIQIHTLE